MKSFSHVTSTSHSPAAAPSWMASITSATTVSARAGSSERTSASSRQRSGTTLVEPAPPWMEPTFAVVSSSMRPCGMAWTAWAAASTAERPSSGRTPAWAARPRNSAPIR